MLAAGLVAAFGSFEHAYVPGKGDVLNESRPRPGLAFDVWGKDISREEADRLGRDAAGGYAISAAAGAVPIDDRLLRLGEETFYGETFGNEVFLSDVLGVLDGPITPFQVAEAIAKLGGRAIFERAGCLSCHGGPYLSNNRNIPAPEIGTEPARATAMKQAALAVSDTVCYAFDTPVPVPAGAKVLKVPVEGLDPGQIELAWARGDSPGGYKVPSLIGLYWTAPYLHDGGVAVGPDEEKQLGAAGTLMRGVPPRPG